MHSGILRSVKTGIRRIQHEADAKRLTSLGIGLNNTEYVHFSLDDVHQLFIDAQVERPGSIFDLPLLSELRDLHEKYDVAFTLYCFEDSGHRLEKHYCDELKGNEDWMRIGYHADKNGTVTEETFYSFSDYYCSAGLTLATSLRLHMFNAPLDMMPHLRANGVKRLFCSDDRRDSYGIAKKTYEKGHLRDGIIFIPTDIRLEHNVTELIQKSQVHEKSQLIIFGHEMPFINYREGRKIEAIIQMLPANVKYEL